MKHEPFCIGFGMLRIDPEKAEHREALAAALAEGVDLFDLGDFQSEDFEAKAALLETLTAENKIRVLVRGSLGKAAEFGKRFSGRGKRNEVVYLVADPEFALPALEWDHARLYSDIEKDLEELESLAVKGILTSYGVGSAGFTYPKQDPEVLALEPLLSVNRPHFEWVEFPFNLYESEAAIEENQNVGPGVGTLLEATRAWNLRTIARRPFDAITEQGLRRLVAYPDHHRLDLDQAVLRTLEAALAAETEFLADRSASTPLWAHRLRDQLRFVTDPEQWKEILRRRIEPDLKLLRSAPEAPSTRYFDAMEALLLAIQLWCEKVAAERNEYLRCRIVEAAPTLGRKRKPEDRDLAILALRVYRSIPGLHTVLVGMRSPKYVQSLTAASTTELPADERIPGEELRSIFIATHLALNLQEHPHS